MIRKYKILVPSIILLFYSIYACFISVYIIGLKQYLGLFMALICVLSFFLINKYYSKVLLSTLILGVLNLIVFNAIERVWEFGINGINIELQSFSVKVSILAIILFMPKKNEIENIESENVTSYKQTQFDEDVEKFKSKFELKSVEDLHSILLSDKYTPAAKEAAKQILTNKEKK